MKTTYLIRLLPLLTAASLLSVAFVPLAARAQDAAQPAATTTTAVADLAGMFSNFQIKPLTSGMLKVAGKLTITNVGAAKAKNVRVNFYVSTDTEIDPTDLVHTFSLADYNSGSSRLKSGGQVEIALKQKVVSFIGSLLEGQYLLIELVADNNTTTPADRHNVIAVGPISVPK